jgi:hypothetical protein
VHLLPDFQAVVSFGKKNRSPICFLVSVEYLQPVDQLLELALKETVVLPVGEV